MNWKKTLLTCVAVLLVAAGALILIYSTEPTAQRSSSSKQTAMLVDVTPVESGGFNPKHGQEWKCPLYVMKRR